MQSSRVSKACCNKRRRVFSFCSISGIEAFGITEVKWPMSRSNKDRDTTYLSHNYIAAILLCYLMNIKILLCQVVGLKEQRNTIQILYAE